MHARIDQLLSLRDGEPLDADVRSHVGSCRECAAVLARLQVTRERLRALPPVGGDSGSWRSVQARLAGRALRAERRARASRIAAAASVAALAAFAGLEFYGRPAPPAVPAPVAAQPQAASGSQVEQLQARSLALEQMLSAMPSRPAVERADLSLPIETLEDKVQWLDHQLSLGGGGGVAGQDAEHLWRERVEVMSSLVQLRYAETQRAVL
jgi:hypothetical protein